MGGVGDLSAAVFNNCHATADGVKRDSADAWYQAPIRPGNVAIAHGNYNGGGFGVDGTQYFFLYRN